MNRQIVVASVAFLLVLSTLSACGLTSERAPTPTPTLPFVQEPDIEALQVESVDILIMESFPIQVSVLARGTLSNGCTSIGEIQQKRDQSTFYIDIFSTAETAAGCSAQAVPFEESIQLDVEGIPAGLYSVDVNGRRSSFVVDVDNIAQNQNGVIGGRVWHDSCAISEDGSVSPSAGCITQSDGSISADGILDDQEEGLGGIAVNLGSGQCPSSGMGTAITDGSGNYLFSGLSAGSYCVSIDLADTQNSSSLIPGMWTFPQPGDEAAQNVELAAGQSLMDINFGWDYQFLPEVEIATPDCTDLIDFVEDVTIDDNTVMNSGEAFNKTWALKNEGTCTWDSRYSLIFAGGDDLSEFDEVPLDFEVSPGQTAEFSVPMTAPQEGGTYRSEWKLRNPQGELIGLGDNADVAFWVQIVVEP